LAYWLVREQGPKLALPGRSAAAWLEDVRRWPQIREALVGWVTTLARKIREGAFPLAPRSENCTQTCPYGQVCRIGQARAVGKAWDLPPPVLRYRRHSDRLLRTLRRRRRSRR
jgi:hypothetical protein